MIRKGRTTGSEELFIPAATEQVYRTITDIPAMGERSQECRAAR